MTQDDLTYLRDLRACPQAGVNELYSTLDEHSNSMNIGLDFGPVNLQRLQWSAIAIKKDDCF
jgi:hypothetical protein